MMSKEKRRVPKLRFPGFTEDWEQRKLGAMCSLFTDGDWIESKDQSDEGIRLIQTGNIGVGKFIDKPENKKWISHSTFNNLRCKELLDGDILISRLPHPAGRACIISTNNEKWITAVDCTIVRLLDRYSNKFILQSLCTYNYFHLIDSFLAGGTRQRVSRSNLSDINIMSPEKIEQNKIGLFFECVDNLITLHHRKLDNLKLKKKALLQKLFPKNGERYPEFRFPGFTDAWEQRKLSDILKVNSGKDYKHLDQGNIPVYGTGGYMLSVNESLSNIDAIGIGRKGTIDKPQYLKAPFWTVDTLFYLTALDKHSILFLYYLMQLIPWKKFDESTGVPSLSKTTIDNISGFVPSNSQEEELISALFNQLDKSITLHQRKLEHLQLQKKALLQQLFI